MPDMPDYRDHFTYRDREALAKVTERVEWITRTLGEAVLERRREIERDDDKHEMLENRLRALENFRWYLMGACFMLSLAGTLIGHISFK